jgi:peptidoglycan-N-acetylglucosamine deacetylase
MKRLYPRALWNLPRTGKDVYLTFDDGPVEGLTTWVLDELKRYDARATFFCVGENIRRNPQLFSRITSEGHLAANHTMTHRSGLSCTVKDYISEADTCAEIVGNRIFRPPYGRMKRSQYKALIAKGYKVVMWDVVTYDYERIRPEKVAQNAIRFTRPGSIVLFHDNTKAEANLKHALPRFLEHFASLGYSFRVLPSF